MLNVVPVFGWIINMFIQMSVMFPLWFLWTACGYGSYYFTGVLPNQFLSIPYWDLVALAICVNILNIYNPLKPRIVCFTTGK